MSRLRSLLRDKSPDTPPTLWMLIGVTRLFSFIYYPQAWAPHLSRAALTAGSITLLCSRTHSLPKNYLLSRKQVRKKNKPSHFYQFICNSLSEPVKSNFGEEYLVWLCQGANHQKTTKYKNTYASNRALLRANYAAGFAHRLALIVKSFRRAHSNEITVLSCPLFMLSDRCRL